MDSISRANSSSMDLYNNDYQEDDFDAESMLDEEIEEGIDSIMGNLSMNTEAIDDHQTSAWYGNPMGLGFGGRFDLGLGPRRGVRALRHVEEANWWNFPTVDVLQISPKFHKAAATLPLAAEKKKKKKKVEKPPPEPKKNVVVESPKENPIPQKPNTGLLLKLNYNNVLDAWSDKGSPFSDEAPGSDVPGNDVSVRFSKPRKT